MTDDKPISCSDAPCTTCPYRRNVPSGVWAAEEYEKLPPYDQPTMQQPAALFMCHQHTGGLCTGWLQSHAAREYQFDLLALRLSIRLIDAKEVSRVALMDPLVKLCRTGAAAALMSDDDIKKVLETAAPGDGGSAYSLICPSLTPAAN